MTTGTAWSSATSTPAVLVHRTSTPHAPRAIRAESADIPDVLFCPSRSAILRGLLELPALFRTAAARERYEVRARENPAAEISALDS